MPFYPLESFQGYIVLSKYRKTGCSTNKAARRRFSSFLSRSEYVPSIGDLQKLIYLYKTSESMYVLETV